MRSLKFSLVAALSALALASGAWAARAPAGHLWSDLAGDGQIAKVKSLPNFVSLAARLGPAVVNVSSVEASQPAAGTDPGAAPGKPGPFGWFGDHSSKSLGSGFIINSAGYILTNDHVIEDSSKILVSTRDGSQYTAKVVGHDAKSDIALLKIDASHPLPVAPLGDSDDLKVGQWVMAIGNPFGFDHSVTVGVVSAIGRFIPGNYDDFIQTDASINPGNSGGPLIDLDGAVVGINSEIYTQTGSNTGIGFAIPINIVKGEIRQLRLTGHVTRGWLGVWIQKVTPPLAGSLGLKQAHGALVSEVIKDSPAMKAGIKRGDVIVSYDHHPVANSLRLPLLVGGTPLGTTVTVEVVRSGRTIELPVTITKSHEKETQLVLAQPKPSIGTKTPYGLYVKDLSPALAHRLGLSEQKGVVVSAVRPDSPADNAGLRARDVILEVNRQAVKDVEAYRQALKSGGGRKPVLLLVKRAGATLFVALNPEG